MNSVNILTLKWGTLYSSEYVNRIYRGVKAHLKRPFRFVCVTDDKTGLCEGIDAVDFPPRPPEMKNLYTYAKHGWPNIYVKLLVYKPGFADLKGPTFFLDIDQIITGDLDRFFDYKPGEFCIIRNWVELRKRLFRKTPFAEILPVFVLKRTARWRMSMKRSFVKSTRRLMIGSGRPNKNI